MCHAPLVLSRTRIRCSFFPAESNRHNSMYLELSENSEKLTPRPSQVAPRGKCDPAVKGIGNDRESCCAVRSSRAPSSDVVVSATQTCAAEIAASCPGVGALRRAPMSRGRIPIPLAASASFIHSSQGEIKTGLIIEARRLAAVGIKQQPLSVAQQMNCRKK